MKAIFKILGLALLFTVFTAKVNAQSATADATARILLSAGISNAAGDAGDLDWGDILPGASESVVDIVASAAGTRSLTSGDATLVASDVGNAATFNIYGTGGVTVDISLTSANIQLSNGAQTMDALLDLSNSSVILGIEGTPIYVGGELTVAASQATGAYSSTFEVNVAYQ